MLRVLILVVSLYAWRAGRGCAHTNTLSINQGAFFAPPSSAQTKLIITACSVSDRRTGSALRPVTFVLLWH